MKRTKFICQNCGFESPKWLGRCASCGAWETMVEEIITKPKKIERQRATRGAKPERLSELKTKTEIRKKTGIMELDRVLGGGIVQGALVLIGGEPGIGKSTLTLQVASRLSQSGETVLYVSGEESPNQIKLRAERLGINTQDIFVLSEIELETILEEAEKLNPKLLIIDSIQTVYKSTLSSAPGSVSQIRECAAELQRWGKSKTISTFVIGHVTKFGMIAGPKTLEHIVDTVLYFEGDRFRDFRILRAVKNRFGSTNEIGVFEMTEEGLNEVINPSQFFIGEHKDVYSGSVIVPIIEGSRPILVEIQALATPTFYSLPQRVVTGFDFRRFSMLLGVLERRAGITTSTYDVFLNIVGGLRLEEPAADLGIVIAVASSVLSKPVPLDTAIIGEVGLGGEVRRVSRILSRIKEVERLGFNKVLLPAFNFEQYKSRLELKTSATLKDALTSAGIMEFSPTG